jgi:hypothetical protein
MSKRTLFLIFALALITFVLLILAIYQPPTPKPTQIVSAPQKISAQTVLSFGNPTVILSPSSSTLYYSVPIYISTGKNKVTAVQLELQYDPVLFNNVQATSGAFFKNPNILLNQIDSTAGRISYALGVTSAGISGNDTVASLIFSINSKTPQKTAVIFLPKTLVTADGISGSALQEARLGQFTVGITSSTPSAAPTGTSNR